MRIAKYIMIILLCAAFVSAETYTPEQLKNLISSTDLSAAEFNPNVLPTGYNFNGLTAEKLTQLLNNPTVESSLAPADLNNAVNAYSAKVLGKPSGSIIVNQQGSEVSVGSNGELQVKFGSSPTIKIPKGDKLITSLETVTRPENSIRINAAGKYNIFLRGFKSGIDVTCSVDQNGIRITQNFLGGPQYSFPPIKPYSDVTIYSKDSALYFSRGGNTVKIDNADLLSKDPKNAILYGFRDDQPVRVTLPSYNEADAKGRLVTVSVEGSLKEPIKIDPGYSMQIGFNLKTKSLVTNGKQYIDGTKIKENLASNAPASVQVGNLKMQATSATTKLTDGKSTTLTIKEDPKNPVLKRSPENFESPKQLTMKELREQIQTFPKSAGTAEISKYTQFPQLIIFNNGVKSTYTHRSTMPDGVYTSATDTLYFNRALFKSTGDNFAYVVHGADNYRMVEQYSDSLSSLNANAFGSEEARGVTSRQLQVERAMFGQ